MSRCRGCQVDHSLLIERNVSVLRPLWDLFHAAVLAQRRSDETRHISYARALVKALIEEDPSNLDVIQRWQDESLQLFSEGIRGGARRAWWEGFLGSYYKIALPLGLRPTPITY